MKEVKIAIENKQIIGNLTIPKGATGLVIFAHGSGSSRFSPRNQFVAKSLQEQQIATLLIDLLTPEEEILDAETGHLRFNILLLAGRLLAATDWALQQQTLHGFSIGYFGASTGAAAALVAAAAEGSVVKAIVSRGGRPDLAGATLEKVGASTLLIVGGDDTLVIELNQQAYQLLNCEKRLEIVPGATHLFEEEGTLEHVASLAAKWFHEKL